MRIKFILKEWNKHYFRYSQQNELFLIPQIEKEKH